jgi:AmmeMemoRadiSam system protein A
MDFDLSQEEKIILLKTARLSIAARLRHEAIQYPEPTSNLQVHGGAFVSLHIAGKLRGCIGYIQAIKPLFDTIKEMALSAAFSDPRFVPLAESDLDKTEIEISVISPLKKIEDIEAIKIGKHGIMIRRGLYSGLLLPQVATQYGWDREQFLFHTCQKAGLPGNCWKLNDVEIEIFSAIVFSEKEFDLTYTAD